LLTSDFTYCDRSVVCHVRALCSIVEVVDTISFAYDRVKIWLALVDSFLPEFCPKVTRHLLI